MKINKREKLVYKNMGDLQVEDYILATDGKKRKIFSIQEQGLSDIYKITISDGRSFRTHIKHLTPVCFRQNKMGRYVWDNLTTEWMMKYLNKFHFTLLTDYAELDVYDKYSLFLEHENEPDDNIIPTVKEGPYITKIEKLNYKENCRCITIFDPDGQYYTDDGIITHNSAFSTLAQLFVSVHYALMWHPYKFFGLAPSSVFTQCMGGWNQKKASELLVEPFIQILECSPYFKRVRTHNDLTEASAEEVAECLHWTTSSPTAQPLDSKVYLPDGNYKLMKDVQVGDIIASPSTGSVEVTAIPFEDEADCYEIELEDGRTVRCSDKHLWKVRRSPDSEWEVRDLKYIMEHPEFEWEIIEIEDIETAQFIKS